MSSHFFRVARFALAAGIGAAATVGNAASIQSDQGSPSGSSTTFEEFVDRIPEYLADKLPGLDPNGAVRVFVQPHLGDFMHHDYIRTPVGVRMKFTEHWEANADFESYLAHGNDTYGSGFSQMNLGLKCEDVLRSINPAGIGVGASYRVPFNGSPPEFSDGYRHLQPYVAATHAIFPRWHLLGYASIGANFLERTRLPSNFGRNQLHANSMAVTTGVAREWGRVHVSVTARVASTALTSDEGRQNFSLKPELVVPLRRNPNARAQVMLTVDGRAIWGPDGRSTGVSTGLRVNFHLDRSHANKTSRQAELFAR